MGLVNKRRVIVDTGPLVAFIAPAEPSHLWAIQQFKSLHPPLFTCEAVLTETFYFLSRGHGGPARFFDLIASGMLAIDFAVKSEISSLERLINKYQDLPMSFADACLVRMAEEYPLAEVLTLDHHFKIYRRNSRQPITAIMPKP